MSEWSLARAIIFRILKRIQFGKITLLVNDKQYVFSGNTGADTHAVSVIVHDTRLFRKLLISGTNGAAESYISGQWEADNLTLLVEIILVNQKIFQGLDNSFSLLLNKANNILHVIRKNYKSKAKKNILAHYDLGNDFFKLFLDQSTMYSCAVYESQNHSLEEAAIHKLDLIGESLQLNSRDHVLEIGSGWGGFAIYAAQKWGCRVTTTTISDRQYHYVKEKIQNLGLQDKVEILNKDYRELQGQYDKLISIEMVEAVGHHFFKTFFKKCNSLVKPGGLFFLQAITINDQAYHKAKNEIDFIKKYIFPGGCLPSPNVINETIAKHTQMQLMQWRDIGKHYVKTLMDWRERFLTNIDSVRQLGFNDAFIRMWDMYFCYCAAGFKQFYINDIQALWQKEL